ncbi:hypothetical protein [Magnetospirillum aberrantis]|uniref:Uncharacterized protein n=1 Tax=Magnetospirillum aberrantis SpK TaxID=908842 RepID=A0A7C9UTC2_9PROT|nr:hypothetical protein [Magnetospirillum aberrantis]NFV78549.1 hypothetical protein [Magnetospirillum aberrantis SpK]
MTANKQRPVAVALCIAWLFVVTVSYFTYNADYYREKTRTFSDFIARRLG